jgi:hypothetical protein
MVGIGRRRAMIHAACRVGPFSDRLRPGRNGI